MSREAQRLIDQLAAEARASGSGNFGAYEADHYEVGAFETYLVSTGMDTYTAKSVAEKAAKTPAVAAQLRQAMSASNGQGLQRIDNPNGGVLAAANFGITVTRLTAAIAGESLPFVIFGSQDYQNGYREVIQGQLAAGTVLTSVLGGETNGLPDRVQFTYTKGANVDIVEVKSGTYPYPALLNSTNVDLMRMSKIRMELSDNTQAAQFREDLMTVNNSPFGKSGRNRISATAFRRPDQYQNGIVDIDAVIDIDKETGIYSKILPVAGFGVTFNSFVQKFERMITKGW